MNKKMFSLAFMALTAALTVVTPVMAEANSQRPSFNEEGVVTVPSFELPPSPFMSQEAQGFMKLRAKMSELPTREPDTTKSRQLLAKKLAPLVQAMLAAHPVNIAEDSLNGVPVRVVTPKVKSVQQDKVLINLHGGAFTTCWESCSILESAPIAERGAYKVVSVNYRMAPEAKHPAGVEDVEKVYRALLKDYTAKNIGIYGCSAGGALTAQAASWLPKKGLPQAGAVGIFGAGGVPFNSGDSAYIAAYIDGSFPPPPKKGMPHFDMTRGYFDDADMSDDVISPAMHLDTLKTFPPALIITGTRAMDMSPAIVTNSQLIKAEKSSTLIVAEGMGHCYLYSSQLPEAQDAFSAIVNFFAQHLQ